MRRREVIALLAGGCWAMPSPASFAQGHALKRIGWLSTAPHPFLEAFQRGLGVAGYVEGKDIQFVYSYANGKVERLPAMAQALADSAVDVVVTSGGAASQAAHQAIKTTPIVFVTSDPVALGLVRSFARPSGNITGFDLAFNEVASKWVEFLIELLPGAKRFAIITARDQSSKDQVDAIRATAAHLGKEVLVVIGDDLDFEHHLDAIAGWGADAAMVTSTPTLDPGLAKLITAANARRLPMLYQNRDWTHSGGLISYGPDLAVVFQRAALVVDRILRGEKPANIPVERPTKFQLVINLKTATALGLTVPQSLLALADELIE
jgi:putative tryptophan/tyrosine transport system substrate-binding protein